MARVLRDGKECIFCTPYMKLCHFSDSLPQVQDSQLRLLVKIENEHECRYFALLESSTLFLTLLLRSVLI